MPHSAYLLALPAFIDKEAWAGFVESRLSKGKAHPFTERAAKLILLELYKLKALGEDPNACLDQSVIHGWSGVFPVKKQQATRAPETFRERDERQAREKVGAWAPSVAKRSTDEVPSGSTEIVVRH